MASLAKKIEKKMKIIDTAFSLFKVHSVSETAIDDIVKAAGIARGTFYLYFKDKSDLLEQIILYKSMEYMRTVLKEVMVRSLDDENDFFDIVRYFLNALIDFLIENREILPVMQKNISSCIKVMPEFFDREIGDMYQKLTEQMTSLGYSRENSHITVFIVIEMTGSVCIESIMHSRPFPIEKIRDTVIESAISIIKNNATLTRGDLSETLD